MSHEQKRKVERGFETPRTIHLAMGEMLVKGAYSKGTLE